MIDDDVIKPDEFAKYLACSHLAALYGSSCRLPSMEKVAEFGESFNQLKINLSIMNKT